MSFQEAKFSQFGLLPKELQDEIWCLAGLETSYNPDNEKGKLWQTSNIIDGVETFGIRKQVHVLRCVSTLLPWKRFKYGKRVKRVKRRPPESELVAVNTRKTHELLRTCQRSRATMMREYKLVPAFGTLVNFEHDVFLVDFSLFGFPFDYYYSRRIHPILQMPHITSRIKHLAIFGDDGPIIAPGGTSNNRWWLPGQHQQQIKEQFSALEKITLVTIWLRCENIPSSKKHGCPGWGRERPRYTEEAPDRGFTILVLNKDDLATITQRWNDLPTSRDGQPPKAGQTKIVVGYGVEVLCYHSPWAKRRADLENRLARRIASNQLQHWHGYGIAMLRSLGDFLSLPRHIWLSWYYTWTCLGFPNDTTQT